MGQQGKRYTEREREKAMALRATGMSIKDVAERLGCSINAVRSWEKAITSSDPEKMARLRLEKRRPLHPRHGLTARRLCG